MRNVSGGAHFESTSRANPQPLRSPSASSVYWTESYDENAQLIPGRANVRSRTTSAISAIANKTRGALTDGRRVVTIRPAVRSSYTGRDILAGIPSDLLSVNRDLRASLTAHPGVASQLEGLGRLHR